MGSVLSKILKHGRTVEVLKTLQIEPKKRQELEEVLSITTSHLSQILKRLEQQHLVKREGDTVHISPKGEILLRAYCVNQRFSKFLQNFGDFINDFDISDIPDWLISRLYELDSIDVVETQSDFLEPHNEFFSVLDQTVEIRGYTPVFFREHVDFFLKIAEEGVEIEIIVSEEIFRKILNEFPGEIQRGISLNNVGFYVSKRKFKFAFIVTESILSISFYLRTGVFDYKRDFLCRGSDAVRWGNDLFEYVRRGSEPIDRQKLKELLRNQ